MDRFNALLAVLRRTCAELQRAVKGLAVMSPELEDMATSLTNNQVGVRVCGAHGPHVYVGCVGICRGTWCGMQPYALDA